VLQVKKAWIKKLQIIFGSQFTLKPKRFAAPKIAFKEVGQFKQTSNGQSDGSSYNTARGFALSSVSRLKQTAHRKRVVV
jgi:hypothetical protein